MPQFSIAKRTSVRLVLSVFLIVAASVRPARAQSYGAGDSPGRAAYRTPASWNNGPFYTAPHWDPWAPRREASTSLIYTEAQAPPFTNQPRGPYTEYYPEKARLYPYQEGFSPFSGYADWYQKKYGVVPDEDNLAGAAEAYFRSSPIPPDPRYLAPDVSAAIYNPTTSTASAPTGRTTSAPVVDPTRPRVALPPPPAPRRSPGRAVIYRGGVSGPQ
jgi:hypothetical protein